MADASLVQKGVPSLILQDDLTRQLRSMAADAAQAPCQAVFDLNEFNELTSLEASFWLFVWFDQILFSGPVTTRHGCSTTLALGAKIIGPCAKPLVNQRLEANLFPLEDSIITQDR